MPLDTFVAGAYTGAYASVAIGITEDGFTLEQTSKVELINNTDIYGESVIDWTYRGGDVFVDWTSKAYKAGSIAPFWPYGALGVMSSAAAPIGRLGSDIAAALVLSSVANTPAAASPASLTGSKALLAPGTPQQLLFSSKVRNVPVKLQLLPVNSSGTTSWFGTT